MSGIEGCAASLDRLVALGLHRLGWMDHDEAILSRRLVRLGTHVVDVGANIGLYSLLLARLVDRSGSVLAFEPERNLYETKGARLKRLRSSRQLVTDLKGRRYTNLLAARDVVETDD